MNGIMCGVCSSVGLLLDVWWVCFYLFVDRLQPNVDTRQKQLAAWCSLALSYCRHHKLYTLDVMEAQESPVFNNKKIERILTVHLCSSFYPTWHNTIQDPLVTVCSERLVSAHMSHVYQDCLIWMIIQRFYELPPLWGCKKTHTHKRIMFTISEGFKSLFL